MRLSTPPLVFLALLGSAAMIRPEVDEYLAKRAHHRIIVEMAERGRLRAEREIASGRLEWPNAFNDPVVASEWCRRYGVAARYAHWQSYITCTSLAIQPSEAQSVEVQTYEFFVRAHIRRVVGEDALQIMGWLASDRRRLGLNTE